jgi:hypothetical protein
MVYYVVLEIVHRPAVMLGIPAMIAVTSQQTLLKAVSNSGIIILAALRR